jgi:hypothetical protein
LSFLCNSDKTISFNSFCSDFINYLEEHITPPSILNKYEDNLSPIPDERPEREIRSGEISSLEIEVPPLNFNFSSILPIEEINNVLNQIINVIEEKKETSFNEDTNPQYSLKAIIEKNTCKSKLLVYQILVYYLTLILFTTVSA